MRKSAPILILTLATCHFAWAQDRNVVYPEVPTAITTGDDNSFLGEDAGASVTSGSQNIMVGYQAGANAYAEYAGAIMIGYQAGLNATGGNNITIIGSHAGQSNQNASQVFIGSYAGQSNTSGKNLTFIGSYAGQDHTTGNGGVFIGYAAGRESTTGNQNTFIGNDAGYSGGTGSGNTAAGYQAAFDLDTGHYNTVMGAFAGTELKDAIGNVCFGMGAAEHIDYADFNTVIGAKAGFDLNRNGATTNANRNLLVGPMAGYNVRQGEDNVIIGAFAGRDRYESSLFDETSWDHIITYNDEPEFTVSYTPGSTLYEIDRRTALGSQVLVGADDAVAIGYEAFVTGNAGIAIGSYASVTHSNAVAIGYEAASHGNNIFVFGNDSTTTIEPADDAEVALGNSSYRYTNLYAASLSVEADPTIDATLELIADGGNDDADHWQLKGSSSKGFSLQSKNSGTYTDVLTLSSAGEVTITGDLTMNSDRRLKEEIQPIGQALGLINQLKPKSYHWKPALHRSSQPQFGLIAQEVESILPDLVRTNPATGMQSLNYQGLIPILINATREWREQNDVLAEQVAQQRAVNHKKAEMIRTIREQIAAFDAQTTSTRPNQP